MTTTPAIATDLSTMTPSEIDTLLAALYYESLKADQAIVWAKDTIYRKAGATQDVWSRRKAWSMSWDDAVAAVLAQSKSTERNYRVDEAQRAIDTYNEAVAKDAEIDAQMDVYNDEFDRRGGWTRAFIVQNGNGHIHRTMHCNTCFPTTRFGWVTQVSGWDEDAIVAEAGEGACTICYPSAPSAYLSQPCRLNTPEALAKQAATQAEKASKSAEKIAKGITPDGKPLVVTWGYQSSTRNRTTGEWEPFAARAHKDIKTERAAELFVVEALAAIAKGKPVSRDYPGREIADQVLSAMAWKRNTTPEAVEASLAAKVEKKRKGMY
jgi:hypothetical protein